MENRKSCALEVNYKDFNRINKNKGNKRKFLRFLLFQYIPNEINKSLGGTYAQIQIPGSSNPVQQFISNDAYQIKLTLIFNLLGESETEYYFKNNEEQFRDNSYVKDRVDWLFTFCSAQGGNQGQTVRLKLHWGKSKFIYDGSDKNSNIEKGFNCILKSVNVKESQFAPDSFFPLRAVCDIVLESNKAFPL